MLVLPIGSFAQSNTKIDSLTKLYENKELPDTIRLQAMYGAVSELIFNNPDSAYGIILKSFELSKKIGGLKWQGKSYYYLGTYYREKYNLDSAIYCTKKSIKLYEEGGNKVEQSDAFKSLGNLILNQDPDSSLVYYHKSVELALQNGNEKIISGNYINIAGIHEGNGNYPKAIDFLNKGLKYLEKYENKLWEANAYLTIGNIHSYSKNQKKAVEYYLKATRLFEEENYPYGMMLSYLNLSGVYLTLRDKKNVELYLNKTKEISQKHEINDGIALYTEMKSTFLLSYNSLQEASVHAHEALRLYQEMGRSDKVSFMHGVIGTIALNNKQYKLALKHCKEGFEMANSLGKNTSHKGSCECLYKTYKALGLFEKALEYNELYTIYKDSALNLENTKKLTQQEMQFQFDKEQLADSLEIVEQNRQTEIEHFEELEKEKRSRIILFAALGILFLIIGFVFIENRRKKKQATLLEEKNDLINTSLDEKELLLKEIHHRVKNNFQTVSSLLELQSKNIEDEQALKKINEGQNRIKSMALIHQKLYQNKDISTVDFQEYMVQLVNQIVSAYSIQNIEIDINANNIQLDIDTSIPLGLILNELITNTCKYAFTDNQQGSLTISLKALEKQYCLTLKDSGKGISEEIDLNKIKSLGLRLVQRLTKQLQGNFSYSYANGSIFEIIFKDTEHRKELD